MPKQEKRKQLLLVITGTPGTGKTACATLLAKKIGARTIYLHEFVKKKRLANGYDDKMESEIVDIKKLKKELKKEIAKVKSQHPTQHLIVEGHLACEFSLPANIVFVLRCKPAELKKRLAARNYPSKKVEENVMAEMLDYCSQQAEANYSRAKIFELETAGRSALQIATRIARIIAGKGKGDRVDYQRELKKFLKLK